MTRHVAIIGAGPAGSACAAALAQAGVRVTLIEARAFPRVKVCGEFLSPAATGLLESLVSPAALVAAGARRVAGMVIEEGEREIEWRMPRAAWALSRGALDELLLEKARREGAIVRQPATVHDVRYTDEGAAIVLASGEQIEAGIVVHADGHGRFDPSGPTPMRPGVIALKCHFRAAATLGGVRMRSCPGAYVGTIQVEGEMATCAMVADTRLVKDGRFDELLMRLWPVWDRASRCSEWLTCGVAASGYIAPGHVRSLRIGNAAGAVEPVGGEGIGLALWSGVTLAEMLKQGWAEGSRTAGEERALLHHVQRRFARVYRARLRVRRPACRATAAALAHPGLIRAAWGLSSLPGAVLRPWWGLTGKPA